MGQKHSRHGRTGGGATRQTKKAKKEKKKHLSVHFHDAASAAVVEEHEMICDNDDEDTKEEQHRQDVEKALLERQRQIEDAKIAALKQQIDETKGIMINGIHKIFDRQEKLEDLDTQTSDLLAESEATWHNTKKLEQTTRCAAYRWTIVCVVVALIVFFALGGGTLLSVLMGWI